MEQIKHTTDVTAVIGTVIHISFNFYEICFMAFQAATELCQKASTRRENMSCIGEEDEVDV